jgi:beta-phosphoglucomutase-like phosphatase (HAD superfamily)
MSGVFVPPGLLFGDPPLIPLAVGGDGRFEVGREGVLSILTPADRKVEFICYRDKTLCYVRSALGYPALYPVPEVALARPIRAVLMDLDGTSVRSEDFWIWAIGQTTAQLLGDPDFGLAEADLPHVSGHSVSEHLAHCIAKYVPEADIAQARRVYFEIVHREMREILAGRGWSDAFQPAPGLEDFLTRLKERSVKVGLVTSGLYEKAWPEIVAAFRALGRGDPRHFYDAIITGGFPLRDGEPGTLGELSPKPHPWLYAETARVGLGIGSDPAERHHVVGIEDSAAGVIAIRLAGFAVIGVAGGNIEASGVRGLCSHFCSSLDGVGDVLFDSP